MKLSSSRRWAIGAVALATLLACSPNPKHPDEPVLPLPTKPPVSSGAPQVDGPPISADRPV